MEKYHKNEQELGEEQLLIKAAQADPARFDVLYNQYYRSVFMFIYKRTDDEELTADITSQVFLKALINIHKFQFRGVPFSAWLFRIAFNEVNLYFRKNNKVCHVNIEKEGMNFLVNDLEANEIESAYQFLLQKMQELNEEDVQLLELRYFEKRSFAEIGVICGITENNSKVKVYRILDKLKKMMKGNPL